MTDPKPTEEMYCAVCGSHDITRDSNNTGHCPVCGARFRLVPETKQELIARLLREAREDRIKSTMEVSP